MRFGARIWPAASGVKELMNLTSNPTKQQLSALLAQADDEAGHHVLWIDTAGEVHLTLLDDSISLPDFATAHPTVRVRFETFCAGNSYVGPEAAKDDEHVKRYFNWLLSEWTAAKDKRPGEIFAD